jgi:hypothetical protein
VNERRNPTIYADNRFFSSSFHGSSKGDDSVAQRLWGQIGVTSPLLQCRRCRLLFFTFFHTAPSTQTLALFYASWPVLRSGLSER